VTSRVPGAPPDEGRLVVEGLGPVKVDRYGGDLLTLVAEHLAS